VCLSVLIGCFQLTAVAMHSSMQSSSSFYPVCSL
jgi:hypothetical protein